MGNKKTVHEHMNGLCFFVTAGIVNIQYNYQVAFYPVGPCDSSNQEIVVYTIACSHEMQRRQFGVIQLLAALLMIQSSRLQLGLLQWQRRALQRLQLHAPHAPSVRWPYAFSPPHA